MSQKRFLRVMKTALFVLGLAVSSFAHAEEAPKMIVEPSATKVSLAKANLIVSTLEHEKEAYLGSYQLKVTPFTFKSETGKLFLQASDETVMQMTKGEPVKFTGKATNDKGDVKVVTGQTTPADTSHGAVSFSVQTENGPMVFNTSYKLVRR
ncbi:MAG: hypothetical protein ABIT76_07775 [Chthoniobacterales bacterium]